MKRYLLIFGFLFVIFSLTGVLAGNFTQDNGQLMNSNGVQSSLRGARILILDQNVTLLNVTKNSSSGITNFYLYSDANVLLATGSFGLGTTINFSFGSVNLTKGQGYKLLGDNLTGNYNSQYRAFGAITFPIANSFINWTDGVNDQNTTVGADLAEFTMIGIFVDQANVTVNATSARDTRTNFTAPTIFNATFTPFESNLTNATLYVWSPGGSLFNTTSKTITGTGVNQTTFNVTGFQVGTYTWNVLACVRSLYKPTNTVCNWRTTNDTFTKGLSFGNQTFNPVTTSGSTEQFLLNLSYDSTYFNTITADLFYNNTIYSGTKIGTGDEVLYNATLVVPNVLANTNKSFFWIVTLTNQSGSIFQFNSSTNVQNITLVSLDNCTTNNVTLIDWALYDEDTRIGLNGTIEAIATLYTPNTNNIVSVFNFSYNYTTSGLHPRICIQALNTTYSLDYQTKYYSNITNGSYVSEYKYGQHILITNATVPINVSLYDLLTSSSTTFQFNVQGTDLSNIVGAIVDVQRQYVPINQFISVESPLTDSKGKTIGHLVEDNVVYNFLVYKNGTLIGTFNNYLAKCQNPLTGDCSINLNLLESTSTPDDYHNYGNLSVVFLLNKATRQLEMDFTTKDNNAHAVMWNVLNNDGYGNTTICTANVTASSGAFTCTIPTLYGNTSIYADIYSDDIFVGRQFFSLEAAASSIFGGVRVILGMMMYTCLTLIMVGHPATIIIGSILGVILTGLFHLADGGTFIGNGAIMMWFIIAGGLLIMYFKNKI